MIRQCIKHEFEQIYTIINDGALAYKGVIPKDCWTEPYMSRDKLQQEMDAGVVFWGSEDNGKLCGVMGLQSVRDVTLVRHAYVLTANQRRGIGASLLTRLRELTKVPMLIGTWANASWAIKFYEKNGFELVGPALKNRLLQQYWTVSQRQAEVSVVLADADWRKLQREF
jgi:N-acetylglutamate synthase-like GNAT family acetyltransferase